MNKLPDRLYLTLELAVADMQACYADPAYIVNMKYWHLPVSREGGPGPARRFENSRAEVCSVCLAGSVIAQTFNGDARLELDPSSIPNLSSRDYDALFALNEIRQGEIAMAISHFYDLKGIGPPDHRPLSVRDCKQIEKGIYLRTDRRMIYSRLTQQQAFDGASQYLRAIAAELKLEDL